MKNAIKKIQYVYKFYADNFYFAAFLKTEVYFFAMKIFMHSGIPRDKTAREKLFKVLSKESFAGLNAL